MTKRILFSAVLGLSAMSAMATNVPDAYLPTLGEMALAGTAKVVCGMEVDQAGIDAHAKGFREAAKADGHSDADIDAMMDEIQSNPQLLMGAFESYGQAHGLQPGDRAGLCGALAKERGTGSALDKMIK